MFTEIHWHKELRFLVNQYLDSKNEKAVAEQVSDWSGASEFERKMKELIPQIEVQLSGAKGHYDSYVTDFAERDYKGEYVWNNDDLQLGLKAYEREVAKIPMNTSAQKNLTEDRIFRQWRTINENQILLMTEELQRRGIDVTATPSEQPDTPVETTRDFIRKTIETIAALEADCEEQIEQYPGQEDVIRRAYRRAIDTIREQL